MASPLFQRYYKRYIVQKLDARSGVWQNVDSFGTPDSAKQFMRQMINKNPSIKAARVFDQIQKQTVSKHP
jgi:hypothetical protein